MFGREDYEGEWQEHAEKEQERCEDDQGKRRIPEGIDEFHKAPRFWRRRQARSHGQVGVKQQPQQQESDTAHGPGETRAIDDTVDHDREDDAAERASGSHDAEGESAALEEPGAGATHCWIKDQGGADGRADTLG
ncbi:MAG: hypothetical protein Q9177_003306 [Variospora cf. flavescens]